jgi:glycosyltransferase involved in cell wall biosynthesis
MLVTVIIPTYNHSLELKRSINSVLKQTYQNFEILIIDDFSEEDIINVVKEINDERIKYFRLKRKGNANIARNLGIKEAKGQYIAMLDADDEWLPVHLERRISKIKEWNCDGIYGSAYINDNKNQNILMHSRPLRHNEKMINYLLSDGSATTPTHFYKANCAREIMWDETLERHQDYDFTCRFYDRYRFISDSKATIIIHANRNVQYSNVQFDSCVKFISAFKNRIDKKIYSIYVSKMLRFAISSKSKKYVKYYKNELNQHIKFISFNSYISSFRLNSVFTRIYIRVKYSFLLLVKK